MTDEQTSQAVTPEMVAFVRACQHPYGQRELDLISSRYVWAVAYTRRFHLSGIGVYEITPENYGYVPEDRHFINGVFYGITESAVKAYEVSLTDESLIKSVWIKSDQTEAEEECQSPKISRPSWGKTAARRLRLCCAIFSEIYSLIRDRLQAW